MTRPLDGATFQHFLSILSGYGKGAFHGQIGYQGNLGLHHPPTPSRLPILLLFMGNVFLIRVTLGYQHRAQGTHLPQGYLGNLFARETLPYADVDWTWSCNLKYSGSITEGACIRER